MEELLRKYQEGTSIEDLCSEFKMGKIKIKTILNENGVEIRKRGGQVKNYKIESEINYENYNVECKNCKKSFSDPTNRSGKLIEHLNSCFPDVVIPTKFKRNVFKNKTGKFWHLDYYNLIDKSINETLCCPLCNWSTLDLTNKTGSFTKHIEKEHSAIKEFLFSHEEYGKYFNILSKTNERKENLENNFVKCKICNEKMLQINNTHLKKHDLTVETYKLLYPNHKMVSSLTSEKLRKQLIINNINMKPTWTSKGEIEIVDFINSLGFVVEKGRNRKLLNGKEIDIIIEEKKICIEYNGLYYHTENMGKYPSYHLDKTLECNEIGYELIHIFEDEWVTKTELVKTKIKHLLGVNNKTKIGARKVIIKPINTEIKNEFLEKYHIQGKDKSRTYLGAFYNEILVGVMCFNNSRNMTNSVDGQHELTRFSTHSEFIINGLGSKMLKYFIKEYKPISIISFADRRWTNSKKNLYTSMGFDLVTISPPDFRYYNSKINKYKRFHKFNFGKRNLHKKYPNIDINKTERELTLELGFDRIWDCGLLKYEYIVHK
jgi:Zn finger protein HypA/HybF involved in hydrogenase expression